MLTWWIAAALAQVPSPTVPEAAEPYEAAAARLLEGPQGCWEVVGTASYAWDGGRYGWARGDATFIGRMVDGTWEDIVVRSLGEEQQIGTDPQRRVYPHDELRFFPLVGRRPATWGRGVQIGDSVLVAVLSRLGDDATAAWTEWSEPSQGVILHRTLAISDVAGTEEATVHVFFPHGDLLPVKADVEFPNGFAVRDMRFIRVRNASASIRGRVLGDAVFPEAETVSFDARFLGFGGEARQTVLYETFRPCGGDVRGVVRPVIP